MPVPEIVVHAGRRIPEAVAGAIVDVAKVRAERARLARYKFWRLPSRSWAAAAQAATPPRRGPAGCPVCCLPSCICPKQSSSC